MSRGLCAQYTFCWVLLPLNLPTLLWRHNGCDDVSNHQSHECLLNRSFRHRSKKTSKLRATGLCAGNSPETGEFPAQMASYAENVSIWWRHHAYLQGYIPGTGLMVRFRCQSVKQSLRIWANNSVCRFYGAHYITLQCDLWFRCAFPCFDCVAISCDTFTHISRRCFIGPGQSYWMIVSAPER